MTIELETPDSAGLGDAVAALARWQDDTAPFQLHPGDLGWLWRLGFEAAAATTRIWRRDGVVVAVGELDGHALVRLGIAPDAQQDEELARQLADDLGDPDRGVLQAGAVAVEAPPGALLRDLLTVEGWRPDESWTPLRRRLTDPVEDPGARIEVVGPERLGDRLLEDRLLQDRVAVQRAAFARSTFSIERWHEMAAGPAYADARCLVAYDDAGVAVGAATVWSAGPDRPGLLEPMGVRREHRGRGSAGRSQWLRRPRCGRWAPRAPRSARGPPTPAASRPTERRDSGRSRSGSTCDARRETTGVRRPTSLAPSRWFHGG